MSAKKSWFYKLSIAAAVFGLVAISSVLISGEPALQRSTHHVGQVEDWSFHHLVFSNPGTYEQVKNNPEASSRLYRIQYDTRYIMQQMKRSTGVKPLVDARIPDVNAQADLGTAAVGQLLMPNSIGTRIPDFSSGAAGVPQLHMPVPVALNRIKGNKGIAKDWNAALLAGGQVQPNMYPAKYSFSTTTASCANDFVVYPTGVVGAAATADIFAYYNLYTTGCGGTVPSVNWAYNTGGTVTTSPVLALDGTQVAFVQVTGTTASLVLLKWAQTPATIATLIGNLNATNNSTTPGVTLTTGTFSASDVGARISDTTIGGDIAAGVTITSVLSTTTALLSTAPTTANGQHLTISAETLAAPGVPPTVAAANYHGCTAPCMTTLTLSGPVNDTYSSPYYDYGHDALYVGDDTSHLHKFTPVFGTGTPAEVTRVTLNATAYGVASPVYDPTSGCVFVGDTQGYLYSVSSGVAGTVCTGSSYALWGHSEILSGGTLDGIFDAPLVDSTAGMVYAFVTASAAIGNCGTAGDNCVFQFKVSTIPSGGTTTAPFNEEPLGTGASNYNLYDGAFDNVYYSSAAGTAGDLWVMGNTGSGTACGGNLYRVPIGAASAMSATVTVISGLTDTSCSPAHHAWSSPITEFCANGTSACVANGTATTGGIDYIYFSVDRLATATTNCGTASGNGCLLGYSINTPTSAPTAVGSTQFTDPGSPGCWTTSGIIVDNALAGTLTGASQIYFMTLNANGAGGPTLGLYTSANCTNADTNTPTVYQESQSAP